MSIILNVEFAFAKGVPELDGSIPAAAHNLSVVSTETDAKDIRLVSNEATCRQTGVQVPKAESMIPRRGKGKLTVRRNDDVRDEVVVTMENTLGESVLFLRACQLPDDDSLVWVDA